MKLKLTEARQLDNLGRLVLPKKMREALNINEGDFLKISLENNSIVIRRDKPACVFCSSGDGLIELDEKHICRDCLNKLNNK